MSFNARAVTTAERNRPPRGKSRARRDSVAKGNGIGSEANAAASDFPSGRNQRTTAARGSAGYLPLAQGAIDYALAGVTSLAEAMAVGGGLEELVEVDAGAPLEDSIVATLLEQQA